MRQNLLKTPTRVWTVQVVVRTVTLESGSKLIALHTLRDLAA
jgi:hypothetical protein